MTISFKGAHFPQEIILMGVRWYLAYPLSYRHVEELMEERGVLLDHATIQRWVVKYSPLWLWCINPPGALDVRCTERHALT
jgi:putative transposase